MLDNPHVQALWRHKIGDNPNIILLRKKIRIPHFILVGLSMISWETVLLAVTGFLLGRAEILGSLLPFGPAYFAAVVCCYRKKVVFQALPVIAGLFTVVSGHQLIGNIGVIVILTIVFLCYSVENNRQWVAVPVLVLTSIVVVKGAALIFGHASEYMILVTIFESLFAAGLSMVFLVVIGLIKNQRMVKRFSADEMVCIFVCILGIIMGLGEWSIRGLELRSTVSRLLIILAALLGGGGAGAGMGALVGIIPSLSDMVAPTITGMYAFSGLLAGSFNGFGRIGVVMGFILGNLLLALYLLDTPLILASLAATGGAALLFFIIPEGWLINLGKLFNINREWSVKGRTNDMVRRMALKRLNGMSKIFGDLACTLDHLSGDVEGEEEPDINSVLGHISNRVCYDCTMYKICWERDFYQTYRSIMGLFAKVESNGYAVTKDIPVVLQKRCAHASEMLATVNCLYELYKKTNYWQQQMGNTRNLVANQLMGSAEIMDRLIEEIKGYGGAREILEKDLIKVLSKMNFLVDRATVLTMGENTIDLSLELQSCPGVDECHEIIPPAVSRLTGKDYEIYQSNCSVDTGVKTCWFRMLAAGARRLSIGKAQVAKKEGTICGDSNGNILLEEGKQVLMLSDGMGVGTKAAVESSTTLALLEQLLETGFNQQVAINTINSVLMLRSNDESFVTADLCIVDLYSGEADFVKIGGAPSFIKNKNGVKVIKASSLPIGILHTVEMETVREHVEPGDIIVMATDGLFDTGNQPEETERWIVGLLEKDLDKNPYKIAESLLKNAVHLSGGQPRDDITVLVVVVDDYHN